LEHELEKQLSAFHEAMFKLKIAVIVLSPETPLHAGTKHFKSGELATQ
jgi:hypothetical protein